MNKFLAVGLCVCFISGVSFADTFAEGTANEFTIDFVPISGDAGDLGSWPAGNGYTFSGVNHGDYRMGTYEITNEQFAAFATNSNVYWTGADIPSNRVSWYEAAQFVNWLNTSTGKTAAYKFNGSTFSVWDATDAGYDASNPYRNSNAYYFLPTDDEWVKAAYWNGTNLQTWATMGDVTPTQAGWNFYDSGYATDPSGPWDVGDGTQELNGTYDMMGNVWEWVESPYYSGDYLPGSDCGFRGGSYNYVDNYLRSSSRDGGGYPFIELDLIGFRVASVPEPCSLVLLGLGGLLLRKRK